MDRLTSITSPSMEATTAISGNFSGIINNSLNSVVTNCLMPLPTDPGFTERAARYSSFSSGDYGIAQVGILETGKLSRVSSSHSLKSKENSSVTYLGSSLVEGNARKQKTAPKRKAMVAEETNLNMKKSRSAETGDEMVDFKLKEAQSSVDKQGKNSDSELFEPPKDYIHVRARRGEATDSHSLAERARRQKISQRMKLLQDLVPGCSKITGKALMLDEIINYVQSMKRQVEFLSMKLAALNSRLDYNLADLISNGLPTSQTNASSRSSVHPFENMSIAFPSTDKSNEGSFLHFDMMKDMEIHGCLIPSYMQTTSLDVFESAASQLGDLRDDDLLSIIQMSVVQNQGIEFTSQKFHAEQLTVANMKADL